MWFVGSEDGGFLLGLVTHLSALTSVCLHLFTQKYSGKNIGSEIRRPRLSLWLCNYLCFLELENSPFSVSASASVRWGQGWGWSWTRGTLKLLLPLVVCDS